MNWKKTLLACLVIVVVTTGALVLIFSTEPTAERVGATKRTAMLVDVVEAERGDFRPLIRAMGTVKAEKEIMLSPRVSGEILSISEAFTPGGDVRKGDLLLEIDPADFEAVLMERRSALRQAMAELEIEKGRQDVAKQDYELLGESLSSDKEALVLREPQLNTALARVEAARAALRRAELDLERTTIRAPFDAHILTREANVGSLVSPGDVLGRLVGIETYWIEAAVPVATLPWIAFPGEGENGVSSARIRNRSAWPEEIYREGTVHQLIGSLEEQTRLARLLVDVPDPLARGAASGKPPLILGSYVQTQIEGRLIGDVVRLERDYLRQNETVWVKKEGVLEIRNVNIAFRDAVYVYIREGLAGGEQVVTTNLSTVLDGAPLRLEGESE